ncbi:MAG: J domain-containing protein [Planctomycetaceae bacterium]|nr:J domain-containing protein [Planctomycetaceae bacterium]
MLPDYYAILGVPPSADRETIRRAFLAQAVSSHPDCGGSHERMVLVNEAWTILSEPATRARYDQARQQRASTLARQAAASDAAVARKQAASYPKRGSELESWLKVVAADFSRASFGRLEAGMGTTWPTATNSLSAQVFLWGGGILAALLLLLVALWEGIPPGMDITRILAALTFAACGGSWLGYLLHRLIGHCVQPPQRRPYRPLPPLDFGTMEDSVVIRCPRCPQGLKLPKVVQPLAVTCPNCRCAFDLPPSGV